MPSPEDYPARFWDFSPCACRNTDPHKPHLWMLGTHVHRCDGEHLRKPRESR